MKQRDIKLSGLSYCNHIATACMFNRVASLRVTVYYSIIASTNDAWSDLSLVCNVNRFKLLMIFVVMSLTTMLMEGLKLLYFYPIIVLFNIGVLNSIGGG